MNDCYGGLMARDDLHKWNMHFRSAGLPLQFQGESEANLPVSALFRVLGEVKLRVEPENSATGTIHGVPSRVVRPVLLGTTKPLPSVVETLGENDFVLAPVITPRIAERLRHRGTMFADERGNCFVSWPGVLIDVRGRTGRTSSRRGRDEEDRSSGRGTQRTASLFTPRRAQVSALLLAYPSLLRASIRELAVEAEVSVGTANQTLDLLTEAGYLHRTRVGYRIDNVDRFLDAWAHAYPTGLGASRQVFRGTGNLDRLAELKPSAWVSGERAVPNLVWGGHTAHLYVEDELATKNIIRTARLRQEDTGGVIIRSAFWNGADDMRLETKQVWSSPRGKDPLAMWPRAPLPVIYADLISVGDPRLSEVAQKIRSEIQEQFNHLRH